MKTILAAALLLLVTARAVPAQHPEQAQPTMIDAALYDEAAAVAWRYFEQQYQARTGLVNSVVNYPYATIWDIGSTIAALYCARHLDLIAEPEYDTRMRRLLGTLRELGLFDGGAFNKNYRTATAAMAGRNDRVDSPEAAGYGWSATDMGRLLVWLAIVAANEPEYRSEIESIVRRLRFDRIVADGYLHGEDVSGRGQPRRYQEGRLGYEQYAARGFELWGHRAPAALEPTANADPVVVLGVPLLRDRRGDAPLTSEAFVLLGLETGWDETMRSLAWRILEVQQRRYQATGTITIVSEDAIPVPPHYFYYYSVHQDGVDFAIHAMDADGTLDSPRWVSAKAAYAWHALLPSEYTRRAVAAVAPARSSQGWSSGVYESTGRSTGGENINTAAVILEAALYVKLGRPLLYAAPAPPPN